MGSRSIFANFVRGVKKLCCESDFFNIILLIFLYILQGIPLGLSSSIPYLLQSSSKITDYRAQATFSLVYWPFSLKLLWAPIIDSTYIKCIGRRKTWLIPIQYIIGIFLLIAANYINEWLGRDPNNPWSDVGSHSNVKIAYLTASFFLFNFLASSQDIAVDGWALTMLSKKNLGWASTSNAVGQSIGSVIAFVLFLCLESPYISNTFLRKVPIEGKGLITFSGFLYFWGTIFIISTTLVGIFKSENQNKSSHSFKSIWKRISKVCCGHKSKYKNDDEFQSFDSVVEVDNDINESSNGHLSSAQMELSNSTVNKNMKKNNNGNTNMKLEEVNLCSSNDNDKNDSKLLQNEDNDCTNDNLSILETYFTMIGIIRLVPILKFICMILIIKVSLAGPDAISSLKLIENGLAKEKLALMSLLLIPLQAITPLLITRCTNGTRVLTFYSWIALPRLLIATMIIPIVYYIPNFRISEANPSANSTVGILKISSSSSSIRKTYMFTWSFYALVISYMAVNTVLSTSTSVAQMAFHAKISDPKIGGTYMTLLNTVSNIAGTLPNTLLLYLVEVWSIRNCQKVDPVRAGLYSVNKTQVIPANFKNLSTTALQNYRTYGELWLKTNATCKQSAGIQSCVVVGGTCVTVLDGFYLIVGISAALLLITFPLIIRPIVAQLDKLPSSAFEVNDQMKEALCNCFRRIHRRKNHKDTAQPTDVKMEEPSNSCTSTSTTTVL